MSAHEERGDMARREVGHGRFMIREKIGQGAFGDVYLGISQNSMSEVAIKLESTNTKHPQLRYEMKVLKELQGGVGVAELFYYGVERYFSVLVISLLGHSLEYLFTLCRRRLTPMCVMLLGEQMVDRIEYMHNKNFIHRDIKPDNFLIGRGKETDLIHIIDFGLSKRYFYPTKGTNGKHIPYKEGKSLTGTPRYASINNHKGREQSRRDDIESIGYVLAYFARGKLPWQGLKANTKKDKYRKIMHRKEKTSLEDLCSGIPYEIYEFIKYARTLQFTDKPDYDYIRGLFTRAVESGKYGDPKGAVFDWRPGAKNKYFAGQTPQPKSPRPHGPGRAADSGVSGLGVMGGSRLLMNGDSIRRTPRESVRRPNEDEAGAYIPGPNQPRGNV